MLSESKSPKSSKNKQEKKLKGGKECKVAQIQQAQCSLTEKIMLINQQAHRSSEKHDYNLALSKLREGQKLLQYAAESCKNIKKELIILILHNTVSVSQACWDLSTASDYLEGLIYNLEITAASKASSKLLIEQLPQTPFQLLSADEIQSKIQLTEYYLQYCAINSQLRKHKNSMISVRKAILLIVPIIKQTLNHHKKLFQKDRLELNEASYKFVILKYLLENRGLFGENNDKSYIVSYCMDLWKSDCVNNKKHHIQGHLKSFSIGNVMTLTFKETNQNQRDKARLQSTVVYQFLLLSMAYFSLATQLKLGEESQLHVFEAKHNHSVSIMIYLLLLPFQSPYIQHIRDNYIKNYSDMKTYEIYSKDNQSYKQLWEIVRRQSVLDSASHLQQDSITTVEQEKRKNQRLRLQNLKLKEICLAQNNGHSKHKSSQKSYEKKAKSLTMNHTNKKASVDMKDKYHLKSSKQKINKTTLNTAAQNENYYCARKTDHAQKKQKNRTKAHRDEIEEKYFELAFKKDKIKSPTHTKRKDSVRSSDSTKDRSINKGKKGDAIPNSGKLNRVRSKLKLKY